MLCNPNKWFGERSLKNAEVNDMLLNLTKYDWTTGKNNFSDVQDGDLGIIKVGNDNRSKLCRTLDGKVQEKLKAGIYAIIEFKKNQDGLVLHEDENGVKRVHFRVIKNLYKENCIIDKANTKTLLAKDFMSFSSKKIPKSTFENIEEFLS